MKLPHLARRAFLAVFLILTPLLAVAADPLAAVRQADDARVAATLAADAKKLDALLSDQLRYAHSSGVIDTKASLVDTLVQRRTVYKAISYKQREFVPVADGVVLMQGVAAVKVESGGQERELELTYLAVWRAEGGTWRFFAWQSSRNPPPAPAH